ncbi:alpha/beta-hydrolase [Polychaeton citri CBS 116435]|uniref:Alpha/beta-hydrolase n=1 Tax=Polychaeton citri CBS 116435 TaxID=1314669 RepID=A0A9P4PZ40_9PEZI|nr:alpha/beta-hydrolase [Polychaeton citri CBS 116435]
MPSSTSGKIAFGLSVAVGLYAAFLGALLTPPIQRFALYAHHVNTNFYHDLDDHQQFGFAPGQVRPFSIVTSDGETLYAWHILPLDVYVKNEKLLRSENRSIIDYQHSLAFKLLTGAQHGKRAPRVVINFHGNAGNIAQGWRTDTYRNLATQHNTHIISVDYRGFGKSTGSPTEAGLILDGISVVNWVLNKAGVPSDRVVIVGQSLGTAVSSAVALFFANPASELLPTASLEGALSAKTTSPTVFAGVVLIAPFWSLPSLLRTYRIGGLFPPVLLPLHFPQSLYDYTTAYLADTWRSGERLAEYYESLQSHSSKLRFGYKDPDAGFSDLREVGSLQLIHAINDADIPYHHTRMICSTVLNDGLCLDLEGGRVLENAQEGKPRVRADIVRHGGHNRIVTYATVGAAVLRAFEGQYR